MDIHRSDHLMCMRFATEKDLERIVEIDGLSFPSPHQWDYYDFKAALKDVFFVFEKKEILGFLIACCWEMENKAILMRMAVHPAHRRKGIGTLLMESALENLKKMNIVKVELDVEIVKPGVVQLCEKLGFKIAKVVPANNEEHEELYTMELRLNTKSHAA